MMIVYLAIAVSIFVAWILLYVYAAARAGAPEDVEFFLAGRRLQGWRQVLTIWATLFSAGVFVGASGLFYQHGIGTAVFMGAAYIGIGITIPLFGTPLWRMAQERFRVTKQSRTSPFDVIFGQGERPFVVEWVCIFASVLFLIPYLTMQMAGIGKLLGGIFDVPYFLICILVLVIIMSYSLVGGLPKIVVTDIVQALATLLFVVGGSLIFFSLNWGITFSGVNAFLQAIGEHRDGALLELPQTDGFFTMSMLLGLVVMHWFIPITQPQLSSRIIATKKGESFNKLGILVASAAIIVIIPTAIFGMGGAVIYDDLRSGDDILSSIVSDIGPLPGALVLFGIFLATLSTTDSILLGLGNVVSDGMAKLLPKDVMSPVQRRQSTMLFVGIAGLILSFNPPELIATLAFLSVGGTLQLAPIMILALMRVGCHWVFQVLSPVAGAIIVLFFKDLGLGELISWHPAMAGLLVSGLLGAAGVLADFGLRSKA